MLFQTAETWAHAQNPAAALAQTMRQTGMSQENFNACLQNKQLEQEILTVRERGLKVFGVNSTPTFFVNGTKHLGNMPIERWDAILQPLLKEKKG